MKNNILYATGHRVEIYRTHMAFVTFSGCDPHKRALNAMSAWELSKVSSKWLKSRHLSFRETRTPAT